MAEPLLVAKGEHDLFLLPQMTNRHGLIAGATGTGKTVSLQVLAESLSRSGVPVFLADVKGDLSGVAKAGGSNPKIAERVKDLALEGFGYAGSPAAFWDVFGEHGHPVRTTVSDMGPLFLSRLLNLNETQGAVLTLVFKVADDAGLLLLDLKDLRAMVQHVGDNAKTFTTEYGNIATASIGAIQRGLLGLEQEGGESLFGEPALDIEDLLQTDSSGHGVVNVLAAEKLYQRPKMYATLLMWLLAELFERLPEVGDREQPKLVLFFDEAHLLFEDAPAALQQKIEQVVRLIRSKGVGVFFVTQNPLDVPDVVLGQLGNRIQHALRAFTPRDQKAVKAAAQTLRQNPRFDVEQVITELGVGEALVSLLDDHGRPSVVEQAKMCPPHGQVGPISPDERQAIIRQSLVFGHYEQIVDRESAYEKLRGRAEQRTPPPLPPAAPAPAPRSTPAGPSGPSTPTAGESSVLRDVLLGSTGPRGGRREGVVEAVAKSAARAVGSQLGRQILRGVFGSILGGSSRR
jgi:DNA helicase HerA-like ATPase